MSGKAPPDGTERHGMDSTNTKEYWNDRTYEETYEELVRQEAQTQSWKFPTSEPPDAPVAEVLLETAAEQFEGVNFPQIKLSRDVVVVRSYCQWLNRELRAVGVSAAERSRLLTSDPRDGSVARALSDAGCDPGTLEALCSRMPDCPKCDWEPASDEIRRGPAGMATHIVCACGTVQHSIESIWGIPCVSHPVPHCADFKKWLRGWRKGINRGLDESESRELEDCWALQDARELITPVERWTQGEYARNAEGEKVHFSDSGACCWSADGAILHVVEGDRERANRFLASLLAQGGRGLSRVNDSDGHLAVLELLDREITRAKRLVLSTWKASLN